MTAQIVPLFGRHTPAAHGVHAVVVMVFLILLGVFVGTVSVCIGAFLWHDRERFAAADAVRARLTAELALDRTPGVLRDTSASDLEFLDRVLDGRTVTERIARELRYAGWQTKPGTFVLLTAIAMLSAAMLGSFVSGTAVLVGACVGLSVPAAAVLARKHRRLRAFQDQLPDALDMLVSAMRAGYSYQMAMKFIGDEIPAPLGPEFMRFYDEQRLGMDVRSALLALQDRTPSVDLRMFVTAVLIQRETGGNLAEVLGNIADVMRERADVHRQIETLTADSRLSARVLAALPMFVFIMVLMLDPSFLHPLTAVPLGRALLVASGVSVVLGYWIMMRIAAVDV